MCLCCCVADVVACCRYDEVGILVDLTEEDFDFMSIDDRGHRKKILAHAPTASTPSGGGGDASGAAEGAQTAAIRAWLAQIGMEEYTQKFMDNGYVDMNE